MQENGVFCVAYFMSTIQKYANQILFELLVDKGHQRLQTMLFRIKP